MEPSEIKISVVIGHWSLGIALGLPMTFHLSFK